jgi:MurNAc alpha-1-phosphate uridylyltransferase
MKAMILAAGRGSRFKELTDDTPKPLIPVNGKPLIEYHLENLQRAGFEEVVVNVSWLSEKLEDYFQNHYKGSLKVIIYNEREALETGGGVLAALSDLSEDGAPFLVVNADVMTNFDFRDIPQKIETCAHLFLIPNPLEKPVGDFNLDKRGLVKNPDIEEVSALEKASTYTFSGISLLTAKIFENCKPGKFSLADLFREYADLNKVSGQVLKCDWFDVGTKERLQRAKQWQKAR